MAAANVEDKVLAVLDRLRPHIQMDGGDVELVSVDDGIVTVRMMGACVGCPMSVLTLKAGIERSLKQEIPEIYQVVAVD